MVTVREVEDNDIIPLAESLPKWGNHFSGTTKEIWLQRFEIWWNLNPAFSSDIPRGWILENERRIVGFIGNVPVKFLIRGEERIAVAAVDWFVESSIRGIFSIKLFNEYMNQKSAYLFLFNTLDEKIIGILNKYKFKKYCLPLIQTEYFYILKREKVTFISIMFLNIGKIHDLYELLRFFTRLRMLICSYIYQKPVIQFDDLPGNKYRSSVCTYCDDSFSRIWKSYQDTCDITMSRDIKTLNWLYFSSVTPNKRVVIQCRRLRDDSLAGYMVFDLTWNKKSKVGKMQLKDICIENNDTLVLSSLLSYAIEFGKQNNATLMVVWSDSKDEDAYLRSTLRMRKDVQYHRFIKVSDDLMVDSESLNICASLIAPPHGIIHI